MKTFGSCHLIINNRNSLMTVGAFVTLRVLIFFRWGGISTPLGKWTPSTIAKFSSRYICNRLLAIMLINFSGRNIEPFHM